MTTELKQAAQQAVDAFDAFGDADDFASLFELTQKMRALRAAIQQAEAQQPATPEPVAWNSIQIASWIGSQLMHEPSMFERSAVCKFVRSLGRHPTLLKHSPKIHPAPSVPADVVRDAERYRWLRDNGVLGFSGAPSWRVSVSFDAMDAYAQTLDSNIDAAKDASA